MVLCLAAQGGTKKGENNGGGADFGGEYRAVFGVSPTALYSIPSLYCQFTFTNGTYTSSLSGTCNTTLQPPPHTEVTPQYIPSS